MDNLYIAATKESPLVYFDRSKKQLLIRGCSVMQEVTDFYEYLIEWVSGLNQNKLTGFNVAFDLEYFNIASSKRILFILYKLAEISNKQGNITVTWCFKNDDDDMKEVGEDFAFMINLPFNFVSYNEGEIPEISAFSLV